MTDDIATVRDYVEEGISLEPADLQSDFQYVLESLDRVAARLADSEQAVLDYQKAGSEQADETIKWRKRAEQAELLLKGARREREIQANAWQARARELADALVEADKWLVVPSDVPEQHHEALDLARKQIGAALAWNEGGA